MRAEARVGWCRFLLRPSAADLSGRLIFLDSLRGMAAISVMLFHFYVPSVSAIHSELAVAFPAAVGWVFERMYCGVDVFFVLSGFVISFSMHGQVANLRYAGNFIVRRSLRLDPPYWVALTLMLGYYAFFWPSLWHDFFITFGGVSGIAANFFYLQNLSFICPTKSILDVSWTLCLEVQFYLTYLLILVAGYYASRLPVRWSRTLRDAIVVLAVGGVASWSFACWINHPSSDFAGRSWTFFLGVSVFVALKRRVPLLLAGVPLGALVVLFLWKQQTHGIATAITASAIFAVGGVGRLSTLLSIRPLLHLGRISYSIYLVHSVVGVNLLSQLAPAAAGRPARALGAWVLAVGFSLVAAELLHRTVEAPSNRLSQFLKLRRT